ncbi:A-kinase anchor protein 12 [Varanus komodoensis]|nr:A-kinase anchor protein 12 [Varanus komodoensis]
MEPKLPESVDKTDVSDEQKDTQDADKHLPLSEEKTEELEQPSESPSNDVGFKKVFKLVGFKFTVRKDKTEKVEPVQLLNVKADDTEVASDGAGDYKEIKIETVEESTRSEGPHGVEKSEQETQTEQIKEGTSPEKVIESSTEAGSKETEMKSNGSKSPESPTSPLTSETASPLRKFFTHGWAGFRKKTSFRKPKEEETQAIEKEKQEKEAIKEDTTLKEELEKEKPIPEKSKSEASVDTSYEKVEKETEKREETKMIDASTETHQEEAITPAELLSVEESDESLNKDSKISLKETIALASEEKLEPEQVCIRDVEQSTLSSSEKKPELAAHLTDEVIDKQTDQSSPTSPLEVKRVEEHVEDKTEPNAPLAIEFLDEKPTDMNIDVSTAVKKEEPKITKKELVLEQLVGTDAELQRGQPTEEQLKVKEILPEIVKEQVKQTELTEAATSKPSEGFTNEVELLSSQEKAKMQGSPLKKLFTSTSLKKLSVKKHKGKREEAKSGETAEQMQQLSDSAESPEDPRGESSASSPEEATESVEKVADAAQITETEEGSTSDIEKKRESITPWASFKKMVTPKKRVRRLSESDKEDELEKPKSATLSSTESAPCEEQDTKENGEEQKLEKSTEEPKRKVDTSVSWEALICVGSSKKRTRKSSSSDEEIGQRFAQEVQKIDEGASNKEIAPDMTFTSSQESDQGQGNSSPEQAGSPSEGEGVSTWESFKRLVTPRRKSKTKMEERNEEYAMAASLEHSTSDGDSGKEESWVSFKKLMPGRRKKKSDGIPEHAPVQEAGEEMVEANDDDSDIPAVVPLSEYEAAEQEKCEAPKMTQDEILKKTSAQSTEKSEGTLIVEQSSEGLVHAITVTVVEGERAIMSIDERSPSWISAAMTESIEHASEDEEKLTEQVSETGIVEETVVISKLMPEIREDASGESIISEIEITSEAITAREEASGVEEATEVSCAEETTEMVSAVSRLSESPDTTEIATPVQEPEESSQNLEQLNKHTQEILQEVAERVTLSDEVQVIGESMSEIVIQSVSVEKVGQEITVILTEPPLKEAELAESSLKEEEPEKTDMQIDEDTESHLSKAEIKESVLKEVMKKSDDVCMKVEDSSKETISLDRTDEIRPPKVEQEVVERPEEIIEKQTVEEISEEEEFVIVTVSPEEEPEVGDIVGKEPVPSVKMENEEYCSTNIVQEVKMDLEKTPQVGIPKAVVAEADDSAKTTCEEKPLLSQECDDVVTITSDTRAEQRETGAIELKKALSQNEVKELEAPIQNAVTKDSDLGTAEDAALGLETSTEEVAVETHVSNKDPEVSVESLEIEMHVQKKEPEAQLPELDNSVVNGEPEPLLLETQIHAEIIEKEMPIRKEVDIDQQNLETMVCIQKIETNALTEKQEGKSHIQSVEAKVLAEKEELKDVEFPTERAEMESAMEDEAYVKETEEQAFAEKARAKLDVKALTEKVDLATDAGKKEAEFARTMIEEETSIKKLESEAFMEKMEGEVPVERAEAEVLIEKADATGYVDVPTDKADAKLEAELTAEKVDVEVPSEQTDAKLDEEVPAVKMDMESHAEKDSEVAKEKSDVEVPAEKTDVEHSTEEAKMEFSVEKAEAEVFTGSTEVESSKKKTGVVVFAEKVDTKMDAKASSEKVAEEVPADQSEEMMETEAITKLTEPKEILQTTEDEVRFQSQVEDITKSLATCIEVTSAETSVHIDSEQASVASDRDGIPVQTEKQDVVLSLKPKSSDAVFTEDPSKSGVKTDLSALEQKSSEDILTEERSPIKISAPKQDEEDPTQTYGKFTLESQCIEVIADEVREKKDLKDAALEGSKCAEEAETPVQKEIMSPPVKTDMVMVKSIDTAASGGPVQEEKEDACPLESTYTEADTVEDTVQSKAAVDSMKKELGMVETESTGTVITEATKTEGGGDLTSCSGFIEHAVSNAILDNKGDSSLPDLKSEGQEAGLNGIAEQIETCPETLPLETDHPLSESTAASDTCQKRQAPSEKVLIMKTEKTSKNAELAGGDILCAVPPQQKIDAEQQEAVTTGILEKESYTAYKSSGTATAAALEEQVIAEDVILMAAPTGTLQSFLEKPKETVFQTIQQVSCAHSGPGTQDFDAMAVSSSDKADSVVDEQVLQAGRCSTDDLVQRHAFDAIPKMQLQKSKSSEESEKKVTSPQRSPSLTHTEFQKDVVQSVTIESQSTKIVLKIIQNAVDKLEETEEPAFTSKQQSDPCLIDVTKSEILEDIQTGQQFPVKGREEKHQVIEQSITMLKQSAEKQETFKTVEEMPLISDKTEDGGSCGSKKTEIDLKTIEDMSGTVPTLMQVPGSVNEVVKETGLQKENGKQKLHSEMDTTVPTETQRDTLEGTGSEDLSKESVDEVGQPKLKDVEAGQTVQIQEQLIDQQTHMKRKEDHSPSTGFVETHTEKDVNKQDYTSSESPQLKSELTES